jgi:DNA-binding NarL/FixJ family response regulator
VGKRLHSRCPETAILILSLLDWDIYLVRAKQAGSVGFLFKDTPVEEIVAAVHRAANGERLWTLDQLRRVDEWQERVGTRLDTLTLRQCEVLKLMLAGYTNQEIDVALTIRPGTRDKYINVIYGTLGVHSRAELVAFVQEHHLEL